RGMRGSTGTGTAEAMPLPPAGAAPHVPPRHDSLGGVPPPVGRRRLLLQQAGRRQARGHRRGGHDARRRRTLDCTRRKSSRRTRRTRGARASTQSAGGCHVPTRRGRTGWASTGGALNRGGGVIVGSGTADTYFTSALAGPFGNARKKLHGGAYGQTPVGPSPAEIDAMPTIVIIMGRDGRGPRRGAELRRGGAFTGKYDAKDVVIAMPASHYMEFNNDTGKYGSPWRRAPEAVLGANAMMGHGIYFDAARGRVGFAESDCDGRAH
ncbi:hypothetical protein THAOC_21659, partial [Thalassiosira oceanica]